MDNIPIKEAIHRFMMGRAAEEKKKAQAATGNLDLGFNFFSIVSDLYYRENFHSDILVAILDINGKHGMGNRYLLEFIALLKSHLPSLQASPYEQEVRVVRERGRRDITIYGKDGHVVIVENKINDARDTTNQIPKYVVDVEEKKHTVDAILYLTLNQAKEPDEQSWVVDPVKRQEIRSKLISLRAFDGTGRDLCTGWLQKCIQITSGIHSLAILQQYQKIIQYLTRTHMDLAFFSEFQQYLDKHPQNCEIALSIKESLEQYPRYILQRILDHFKVDNRSLPFQPIRRWSDDTYYLKDYKIAGYSFSMDIIIEDLYECIIDFSVREDAVEYQQAHPKIVLQCIGKINQFEWSGQRYFHRIEAPFVTFEKSIIDFITTFLQLLTDHHEEIERRLKELESVVSDTPH